MGGQYLPVISALIVVLLGGFVNYLASKSVKQQEWNLALVKERISRQEKVFCGFLLCAQRLLMQSIEKKMSDATDLNELNDWFSQIELLADQQVVYAARQLRDHVLLCHASEPKEQKSNFYELKQNFIQTARTELREIENRK